MHVENIDQIQSALKKLPGEKAQNLMSPVISHEKYRKLPEKYKIASVMALLFPNHKDELQITYILRNNLHDGDKHAGQIGFPGGKLEPEDPSFLDCALREVEEEIGVKSQDIITLGELTQLYVFASNFLVYPYVGFLDYTPQFKLQWSEVKAVLTKPLVSMINDDIKTKKTLQLSDYSLRNVPGYQIDQHFLWGATAMMTSELEQIIKSII